MLDLFDVEGFAPHGYCLMWRPWLVTLHAGADGLIALSYFAIPFSILRFMHLRPDLRLGGLAALFAGFILLCGMTHLVGAITLWRPIYEFEGVLKLATGVVSAATALALMPLVPKLAATPKPEELRRAVADLQDEVARHQATLAELRAARLGLERTVEARTAELTAANARLQVVTEETAHRARNLLAVVQSVVRQTAREEATPSPAVATLVGRIDALDRALSSVLSHGADGADLRAVATTQLAAFRDAAGGRIALEGPSMEIGPDAAQLLGLAIHELATNAVKHGALSRPEGRVTLAWRVEGDRLRLQWAEAPGDGSRPDAGPPATGALARDGGFGSLLLTQAAPAQLHGEATLEMTSQGLRYRLSAPLSGLAPRDPPQAAAG
jgi:two-component sensor histidine kinase